MNQIVLDHFSGVKDFPRAFNSWSSDVKNIFFDFVVFINSEIKLDWYSVDMPQLRFGRKDMNGRACNAGSLSWEGGRLKISWGPRGIHGLEGRDIELTAEYFSRLKNIFREKVLPEFFQMSPGRSHSYWPDEYVLSSGNEVEDVENLLEDSNMNNSLLNISLNNILFGPPGTGKTLSVTAMALGVLEETTPGVNRYVNSLLSGKYAESPFLDDGATDQLVDGKKSSTGSVVLEKANMVSAVWGGWNKCFEKFRKEGRLEFVTFHQNYAYEDFIEGLKASVDSNNPGQVMYSVEDGIFKRIAYRAMDAWLRGAPLDPSESEYLVCKERVNRWLEGNGGDVKKYGDGECPPPYVLIIDEINRGNISRIFGELITLIEPSKRAKDSDEIKMGDQPLAVTLPYTKKPFMVPPNLYIIGTMNTADRSLVGLDAALRRRFDFIEMPPRPEALTEKIKFEVQVENGGESRKEERVIDLNRLLTALNKRIENRYDRDHEIGHAFLIGVDSLEGLAKAMRNKILPLLQEYFHDRPEDLKLVLAGKFIGDDLRLRTSDLDDPNAYLALYPEER